MFYFCCYSDSEKTLMQQLNQLPAMEAIQKSEQKPSTEWTWCPGLLSFSMHTVNQQPCLVLVLECCSFLSREERPGKCFLSGKVCTSSIETFIFTTDLVGNWFWQKRIGLFFNSLILRKKCSVTLWIPSCNECYWPYFHSLSLLVFRDMSFGCCWENGWVAQE